MSGLAHRIDGPADAPVLVLANSLGTDMRMWEPQLPALARRFRVVRYDARGHGGSPVPDGDVTIGELGADLLALLDRLGVERASLAGVSLGGMAAMWAATEAPERIERLVLCCTSARLGPAEMWAERARTVRAAGTAAIADATMGRWFTPDADPATVDRFHAMLCAIPREGYAACCAAIRDMDLRERLPRITAATLVIAGADDPAVPRDHSDLVAASIPGARRVIIRRAAHLANVERHEEVTAAMEEHLMSREDGMRVRREVLGDDHVDRAVARTTEFTREFQDLITRYAWGEIWTRPGLDRRTRSCITLTALVAGGRLEELAMHVRAARRNGLVGGRDQGGPAPVRDLLRRASGQRRVRRRAARAGGGRTQGGHMSTVELEQQRLFIGGEWTETDGAATFDVVDPYTGETVTRAAAGTRADAARAIDAAHAAFPGWAGLPPVERRNSLMRAADLIAERAPQIAATMTEEVGATFGWGMFNCDLTARLLREAAAQTHTPGGEVIPSDVPGRWRSPSASRSAWWSGWHRGTVRWCSPPARWPRRSRSATPSC